jgi:hypothetical protein
VGEWLGLCLGLWLGLLLELWLGGSCEGMGAECPEAQPQP